MVEPALPASSAQRRRTVVLVALCASLVAVGVVWRTPSRGAPPAPCAMPAVRGDLLVCDGQGSPAGARTWLAGELLDVNGASKRELEAIPGIGPALAGSIVEERTARGGFSRWEQLDEVPGIGPKTMKKLAAWLRVAPPP